MSRAFVKDDDRTAEVVPPKLPRRQPYYVTPAGLEALHERLASAQAVGHAREVEEAQERVDAALVVDPAKQQTDIVQFGATVTVMEVATRKEQVYRIVGADEADPLQGTISWLSPLAQALLDHRAGERVIWQRPAGNLPLRIVSIAYV